MSLFESGDRRIDVIELIRYARGLDLDLTDVLDRAEIDHTRPA